MSCSTKRFNEWLDNWPGKSRINVNKQRKSETRCQQLFFTKRFGWSKKMKPPCSLAFIGTQLKMTSRLCALWSQRLPSWLCIRHTMKVERSVVLSELRFPRNMKKAGLSGQRDEGHSCGAVPQFTGQLATLEIYLIFSLQKKNLKNDDIISQRPPPKVT